MTAIASGTNSKNIDSILVKETSNDMFSANYVISAYEKGWRKGMNDKLTELEQDVKSQFSKNKEYTVKIINDLVTELISKGVITPGGWVKHENVDDFEVLIQIPQDKFYDPNFSQFYIKANQIEMDSNSPDFHLNIRFINADKSLNQDKLICDGYNLRFIISLSQKPI